jgi:hypothetical protein
MQFRARLAAVTGTAPKSVDAPNKITVKLEPLELLEPDWVFTHLGRYLVVEISDAPLPATPLEQAIEDVFSR